MSDRQAKEAAQDARNRGLENEEENLRDPDERSPHKAVDRTSPEQERVRTPQETSEQSISQLENPPQAEGPRERNNDAV